MKKSILISKCLIGENVRYDGGHCSIKLDQLNYLKDNFNLISLCPEVMAGMSVPRDPIELSNSKIITQAGTDITDEFIPVIKKISHLVEAHNIEIAIMKDESPSCGVDIVYDGSFSGKKIPGNGLITQYLKSIGVEVLSEKSYLNKLVLI